MSQTKLVCTGCSCLCDDIEIQTEGTVITGIHNACLKGSSFLKYYGDDERRSPCLVDKQRVELDEAIDNAAALLNQAKNPMIFGLDNSTLEAQTAGIELARTLGAVIDDCSSFCQGTLVEGIQRETIPSCSFNEVHRAGALIFWGCNPYHSHPRHLSKFSYYAHARYINAGWTPDVVLSCIDVRESELASISRPFFRIIPGEDKELIQGVLDAIRGNSTRKDATDMVSFIRESRLSVFFVGLGLTYALDNDFTLFQEMLQELASLATIAVIPMIGHPNMRGFNHTLFNETGYVNKVCFADDISHGPEYSILEQVHKLSPDCMLIVGSNPLSNMPQNLQRNLDRMSLITIDPAITQTTEASKVVIGAAVSSLETGGSAIRMDGVKVCFDQAIKTHRHNDEAILRKLLDRITK